MNDMIKVNFAAVSNLAGNIGTQVQHIESTLDTLQQAIQKLGQSWEGAAQEGFQAVQNSWNQSAEDLKQTLAKIETAVHAAHDAYQQTESKNASVWG